MNSFKGMFMGMSVNAATATATAAAAAPSVTLRAIGTDWIWEMQERAQSGGKVTVLTNEWKATRWKGNLYLPSQRAFNVAVVLECLRLIVLSGLGDLGGLNRGQVDQGEALLDLVGFVDAPL